MSTCPVIVEIRLSNKSKHKPEDVIDFAKVHLVPRTSIRAGTDTNLVAQLATRYDVEFVRITIPSGEREVVYYRAAFRFFVYQACHEKSLEEQIVNESDGTSVTLFSHRKMPNIEVENVWESLFIEGETKNQLLCYTQSGLLFADRNVDDKSVVFNRVILLHGPPGTGKTSLCQGLAQKVAIYHGARYPSGVHLLEVNAQALFSRWFSESGKLVAKLFELVRSLAQDSQALVFVMIDEVESLTGNREKGSNADPSDAIRVVNAMLTQIDRVRAFPNVVLLATSNLTRKLDGAFLDRADLRLFVGPPEKDARRHVLKSCLQALMDAKIVVPAEALEYDPLSQKADDSAPYWLNKAAEASEGFSGRALRKLPLQAHAYCGFNSPVSLSEMTRAMYMFIISRKEDENLDPN